MESFYEVLTCMIERIFSIDMRIGIYLLNMESNTYNYTLINSGQMKRMTNSCKQFLLMVVKEKKPDKTNVFERCNAEHHADIEKVASEYDVLFQEPKGMPPKNGIIHDIIL